MQKIVLNPDQRYNMSRAILSASIDDAYWPDRVMVNVARALACKPPVKRFRGILPATRVKLHEQVLSASVSRSHLSDAQILGYYEATAPVRDRK